MWRGSSSTSGARGTERAGFTLVEALVALAVAAVLCAAVAAGLFHVAAADRSAERAGRLALAVRSLASVRVVSPDRALTNRDLHGVTVERSEVRDVADREGPAWEHWELAVGEGPSSRLRLIVPLDDRSRP